VSCKSLSTGPAGSLGFGGFCLFLQVRLTAFYPEKLLHPGNGQMVLCDLEYIEKNHLPRGLNLPWLGGKVGLWGPEGFFSDSPATSYPLIIRIRRKIILLKSTALFCVSEPAKSKQPEYQ